MPPRHLLHHLHHLLVTSLILLLSFQGAEGFIVPARHAEKLVRTTRRSYCLGKSQQGLLSMTPRDSSITQSVTTSTDEAASAAAAATTDARRIIYISLEYCHDDLFSGNGIAARSHVRGLSTLFSSSNTNTNTMENSSQHDDDNNNNNAAVRRLGLLQEVIVARPMSSASRELDPSDTPPGVRLHVVPVSDKGWKTTDREFDHETFAQGVQRIVSSLLLADDSETVLGEPSASSVSVSSSLPPISAILAADWTGMAGVMESFHESLPSSSSKKKKKMKKIIPVFFLNFRVYSSMTNIREEDRLFYQTVEAASVQFALASGGAVMAMCSADNQSLQSMIAVGGEGDSMNTSEEREPPSTHQEEKVRTIWPMLRQEFTEIALRDQAHILDATRHRPYFACIVRLSKDKGPQRFVQVCQDITQLDPDFWSRTQVIPLLAGAASQPEFAETVKADLRACVPHALIIDDFLNPEQLSELLQQSRLNIHPALYEAWGMTIVEAAACGVPTLLNQNGAIGAEQLLPIHSQCSMGVDMEDRDAVTAKVMKLLLDDHDSHDHDDDAKTLSVVGQHAYKAAVSWTELAHVRALWDMVEEHTKNEH